LLSLVFQPTVAPMKTLALMKTLSISLGTIENIFQSTLGPMKTLWLWPLFWGMWESQPFWVNLTAFFLFGLSSFIYCLQITDQTSSCAWSNQVAVHPPLQLTGATLGHHRAPLLHICCMKCIGYVLRELYEYLDAFLRLGSHHKWQYIPLSLAACCIQKSGQIICIQW
jgi:hypothetical protein